MAKFVRDGGRVWHKIENETAKDARGLAAYGTECGGRVSQACSTTEDTAVAVPVCKGCDKGLSAAQKARVQELAGTAPKANVEEEPVAEEPG